MLSLHILISSLLALSPATAAFTNPVRCACGFSVNSTSDPQHQVFTDYLETDFTRNTVDGWRPQEYNVSSKEARGPYGKQAMPGNVVPSTQGLQLWAKPAIQAEWTLPNGTVMRDMVIPMSEVDTERIDMLYGSFRIRAKLSGVSGTCGAFFWVRLSFSSHFFFIFAS
jgi:hypothetical protein